MPCTLVQTIGKGLDLRDLLRGRGEQDADPRGIRLRGARIRGRLNLNHLRTTIALALEDCLLDKGLTADAAHLPALQLHYCRLAHPAGLAALRGGGLRVDSVVSLVGSVLTADTTDHGTVELISARIGDQLNCRDATLRNPTGPALTADHLQTDGSVFLHEGFTAEGGGADGTIRLVNARIGGQLDCRNSTVTSRSDPRHRWRLDGLTYTGVPLFHPDGDDREAWLELLRTATPSYAAQPYQQLAAAYRAEGHDSDVRAVLMRQRRDQLGRGALTGADKWWARITGVLLGYGYQPWWALLYLLVVLAVSVGLALCLGGHGALARTPDPNPTPAPAGVRALAPPCTVVQTIGKGLDLGTPFLPPSRTAGGSCEITTDSAGDTLTIFRWFLQLFAWGLAALFIAGFTGIVRKT